MRKSTVKSSESPSRFLITGYFLLFFVLVVIISGGIATSLGHTARPRFLGWVLFTAGSITATLTERRWALALPGIFGLATLNGLIILVSGRLNQLDVPVPRVLGAFFTIVMAAACFTTATLPHRELRITDRIAHVGMLSCFVALLTCVMVSAKNWGGPVCFAFSAFILLLAVTRRSPAVAAHLASKDRAG